MVDIIVCDVPIHRMKLLIGVHYLRADHQTIIFITPPRLTCIAIASNLYIQNLVLLCDYIHSYLANNFLILNSAMLLESSHHN